MSAEKPLIAVVDDDPAVLRGLERLLTFRGFDVRPFSSATALLEQIRALSPDCVLADLSMPGLSGLDLQRTLTECSLRYPIVFVTGHGDIRSSVQAMRAGAVDFLTKPFDQAELVGAIEQAISRGRCEREADQRLGDARQRVDSLTRREREVFEQVVAGYLNKQIAANLGISEKTVKVHRARVMRKMSVRSIAQLARVAEKIGVSPAGR
jgi:FixJ family two-component response regulator